MGRDHRAASSTRTRVRVPGRGERPVTRRACSGRSATSPDLLGPRGLASRRSKPVPLSGEVALSRDLEVASDGRGCGVRERAPWCRWPTARALPSARTRSGSRCSARTARSGSSTRRRASVRASTDRRADAIALAWPDERTIVSGGRSGLTTLWNALPPGRRGSAPTSRMAARARSPGSTAATSAWRRPRVTGRSSGRQRARAGFAPEARRW